MNSHQEASEAAIAAGAWDTLLAEASAWIQQQPAGHRDPRPHFAHNVAYLVHGRFAEAWQTHALCLEAEEDIAAVKAWVDALASRQPDNGYVQLVLGLFLAQSGQSEQSMHSYKEAARLLPQSAYPHYFLAQIDRKSVV